MLFEDIKAGQTLYHVFKDGTKRNGRCYNPRQISTTRYFILGKEGDKVRASSNGSPAALYNKHHYKKWKTKAQVDVPGFKPEE